MLQQRVCCSRELQQGVCYSRDAAFSHSAAGKGIEFWAIAPTGCDRHFGVYMRQARQAGRAVCSVWWILTDPKS